MEAEQVEKFDLWLTAPLTDAERRAEFAARNALRDAEIAAVQPVNLDDEDLPEEALEWFRQFGNRAEVEA